MKCSKFAEKVLGLKLYPWQKEFVDMVTANPKKAVIIRRIPSRSMHLAIIDAFHKKYDKSIKEDDVE